MFNDEKYGEIFQEIRKKKKISLKDMEDIVPRRTLSRYEKGETAFPISKLAALLQRLELNLIDFFHAIHDKTIYPRYGTVFQRLREQKGFYRKDFEQISISSQQIKLFETGIIMLEFDKVYAMLLEMNVSFQDYSSLLNKGNDDPDESLLKQVDLAYYKEDYKALQNFYDKTKDENKYFSLCIKVILGTISSGELREFEGFFLKVDLWTNQELFMFQYVSRALSSSNLKMICTDILQGKSFFEEKFFYQRRLALAGLEITLSRISKNSPVAAKYFLAFAKEFLQDSDELTRTAYHFVESLLRYSETGGESYKAALKHICETATLCDGVMKEWYRKNYEKYVE